jgi:hypothetical protein
MQHLCQCSVKRIKMYHVTMWNIYSHCWRHNACILSICCHSKSVYCCSYANTVYLTQLTRKHTVHTIQWHWEVPILKGSHYCIRARTVLWAALSKSSDYGTGSLAAYSEQWLGYSLPTIQVLILNRGNRLHPPPKISPLAMRSTQPFKCVPGCTCKGVKLLRGKQTIHIHLAPRFIYAAAILLIPL